MKAKYLIAFSLVLCAVFSCFGCGNGNEEAKIKAFFDKEGYTVTQETSTDIIDNTFSSALARGSVTIEQIDEIKTLSKKKFSFWMAIKNESPTETSAEVLVFANAAVAKKFVKLAVRYGDYENSYYVKNNIVFRGTKETVQSFLANQTGWVLFSNRIKY